MTIRARFTPQAWISDNAIDVDPEGETTWDATEKFANSIPVDYRQVLIAEMDNEPSGEALDVDDWFKGDSNAPEWIREWSGPFSIYIRRVEP